MEVDDPQGALYFCVIQRAEPTGTRLFPKLAIGLTRTRIVDRGRRGAGSSGICQVFCNVTIEAPFRPVYGEVT